MDRAPPVRGAMLVARLHRHNHEGPKRHEFSTNGGLVCPLS
jgi:hypothetical protein